MKIQYHYGLQSLSDSALINPCFDGFTYDCSNSIVLMQDMQYLHYQYNKGTRDLYYANNFCLCISYNFHSPLSATLTNPRLTRWNVYVTPPLWLSLLCVLRSLTLRSSTTCWRLPRVRPNRSSKLTSRSISSINWGSTETHWLVSAKETLINTVRAFKMWSIFSKSSQQTP